MGPWFMKAAQVWSRVARPPEATAANEMVGELAVSVFQGFWSKAMVLQPGEPRKCCSDPQPEHSVSLIGNLRLSESTSVNRWVSTDISLDRQGLHH